MEDQRQQTAIDALEVVLRGLLECGPADTLSISVKSADGSPTVAGFTVSRRSIETGEETTAYFLAERPFEFKSPSRDRWVVVLIGDYFIGAANLFLQEILEPHLRARGVSVGKLIAGSREINLEKELVEARCHDEADRRLYP